jgi:hypothetical protein
MKIKQHSLTRFIKNKCIKLFSKINHNTYLKEKFKLF